MTAKVNKEADGDDAFPDELRSGTELLHGQYVIEKFLNSGGFGITYLAKDSLDRTVVIKECFPGSFCRRTDTIVSVRSRAHQNEFQSIVKLFVQEAKNLAKLKHPNIVGVHQIFEDNDTAYMALDYVDGRDLLDILEDPNDSLTSSEIQSMTRKLLDAVSYVHKAGVLHRDISPDNILIDRKSANPVLIDFGAAREEATRQTRLLSAMRVVKDGYSPQEFYIQGSQQSPSSDLYALAATLYHMITGECPPDSQARLAAVAAQKPDPYKALTTDTPGYEARFMKAINQAMNIFPYDRIQTADEWLKYITPGPEVVALPTAAAPAVRAAVEASADDLSDHAAAEKTVAPVPAMLPDTPDVNPAQASEADPLGAMRADAATQKGKSSMGLLLGGVAAVVLIGAVGALFVLPSGDEALPQIETPTPVATTEVAPVAEPVETTDEAAPVIVVEEAIQAPSPTEVEVNEPLQLTLAETTPVEPEVAEPANLEELAAMPAITLPAPDAEEVAATETTPVLDTPEQVQVLTIEDAARLLAANQQAAESPASVKEAVIAAIAPPLPMQTEAPESLQKVAVLDQAPQIFAFFDDNFATPAAFSPLVQPDATSENMPKVDLASADPLPAPRPAAEPMVLSSVMSGWSVDLPFTASATVPDVVGAVLVGAPDWLQTGTRILSVEGQDINRISDIPGIVQNMVGIDGRGPVEVSVRYQSINGNTDRATLSLQPAHTVALLNGFQFNTVLRDGEWRTLVASSPENGPEALQAGDRLVAYIPTNERLDRQDLLSEIFKRELNNGTSQFAFAVNRNGELWVASLDYAGDASN